MLKEYIRKPRLNVCLFLFRAQEGVKKIPGFERLRKWSNKKVAKKNAQMLIFWKKIKINEVLNFFSSIALKLLSLCFSVH